MTEQPPQRGEAHARLEVFLGSWRAEGQSYGSPTQRYFARSFENHGFYRHYEVANEGRIWTFSGELERARIEFSADFSIQTILWKPQGSWLPLCDRVARRVQD